MRPVAIAYAAQIDLHSCLAPEGIALWRRMTALQKAVLSVYLKAVSEKARLFENLREQNAALYFTSAFGEVGAMLRLTESIEENSLPVSPKDFQHSVLNASLAYVSMQSQSHQPGFALSGGYASLDSALHLAARRIAAGLDDGIVLVHADEWSREGEGARAEILVLSSGAEGSAYLVEGLNESIDEQEETVDFDERRDPTRTPWLLQDGRIPASRSVRNAHGTTFRTRFRETL